MHVTNTKQLRDDMVMIGSAIRKDSATEVPTSVGPVPMEYSDEGYVREVLLFNLGQTEALYDGDLVQQAEKLGIIIARPPSPGTYQRHVQQSLSGSADTSTTYHARTGSSGSLESVSTGITSRSSSEHINPVGVNPTQSQKRLPIKREFCFSDYEKYLAQHLPTGTRISANLPPPIPSEPAPSLLSVSTKKSYLSIKNGFKTKFSLRRHKASQEELNSCICCRDSFKTSKKLQTLPCGHNYCEACLYVLISHAGLEESMMPPKCCSQPIPGIVIKSVLSPEDQEVFMKSILQFSTPWEMRIFCPNPICGEFIPKRKKIDPKHPFEVVCGKCRTKACSTCKRSAHAIGQDCPADSELDAVLQMGEKSGWRRCYKCRTLVELSQGCSHITCRCKAQFCYMCGAVWDPSIGCPNYCSGEEELERRRLEEEARVAEEEAAGAAKAEADKLEAAENLEALGRSTHSAELNALRARQINERDRFCSFERKMRWLMWTRHGQARIDILEQYDELQTKMCERHLRTSAHLDDRQVAAEMELRANLEQAERSVQIRLRHMEAYCDGLGCDAGGNNPARVITERDLRELGQQYNLRDDMERLHQSKIKVMRDKQAKQMEQLAMRQEDENEKLSNEKHEEIHKLEEGFGVEEDKFVAIFKERREKLKARWVVLVDIERKKLEEKMKVRYAALPAVQWPEAKTDEQRAEAVSESDGYPYNE